MSKRNYPKASEGKLLQRRVRRFHARRAIPDFHYDCVPEASWRIASHMPARVKRQKVNYFRCKWCLRLFVLPKATALLTKYCSHSCLRHELIFPEAFTCQRNWSRHKMLYFCLKCSEPIRFMHEKRWQKHCGLCPSCHIRDSINSAKNPNWDLRSARNSQRACEGGNPPKQFEMEIWGIK